MKFSEQLEALIHEMEKRAAVLKNHAADPLFLSLDTMPVVAIQRIAVLMEEVGEMLSKARNFSSYQERFGGSLTKVKRLLPR